VIEMATTTSEVSCGSSDWTVLASGATAAFVQLANDGPLLVAVAASKPSAGSVVGARLVKGGTDAIHLTGLASGTDIVYGKALVDGQTEVATVIKTG
jgi:hypothetical protein